MQKRQELAEQLAENRMLKLKAKLAEQEQNERKLLKEKSEANKQSMVQVTKNQLTWKELQEIEDAKRRDRMERRRQELAQSSALPASIAENLQKPKREIPVDPNSIAVGEFKAEDPAKV